VHERLISFLASLNILRDGSKTNRHGAVKQVLSLYKDGQSIKGIVRLTDLSRNTVRSYLARMQEEVVNEAVKQTDAALAATYYNQDIAAYKGDRYQRLLEHLQSAERELCRPGVTRQLLWREYLDHHPDGYAYSQYCFHLQQILSRKDVMMHLEYHPGEQTMFDFAGKKFHYARADTGELVPCEVFVATLPFSGLIFCTALESQQTADFADGINATLFYIQGVTQTLLGDNLRTAVTRSDRYEPVFTDVCYQLAEHYGTTFSAARPGKPRDKAMVEKAVNLIYQHVYAPLRNRSFSSLEEINYYCLTCASTKDPLSAEESCSKRTNVLCCEAYPPAPVS
jgi:transposase